MKYSIYLSILAGYAVLFLLSHGGFQSGAVFLQKRSRTLTALVSAKTLKKILLILFAADLLAIAVTKKAEEDSDVQKGYLYREEYGGGTSEQTVSLKQNGKEKEVKIELAPRKLTKKEKEEALKSAMRALPKKILGKQTAGHVTESVTLPDSIGNPEVTLEWMTDNPDVIDWNGSIGDKIPSEGKEVTLTCELSLEDLIRETSFTFMVYPKKQTEEEKLEQAVNEAVSKENPETDRKVKLPKEISGKKVQWLQDDNHDGIKILAVGILLGTAVIFLQKKEENEQQRQREKALQADYPGIIRRFVLFMNAGMSVRMSLEKIAEGYRRRLAEKKPISGRRQEKGDGDKENEHPGLAEICHAVDDMRKGMTEIQAYERFGRRCKIAEYRTFSDLLIRCVLKGGRDVLELMQKEAEEADDIRRRQAQIRGEEAGTKMLLPMVLMLAIVMAILMVPAMMAMNG